MVEISSSEYQKFLKKCMKIENKLHHVFPDIDRHDLHLIVRNLLMPKKWGRRFLLKKRGGRYVP
jgi:transcriptional regulatory protein LevR